MLGPLPAAFRQCMRAQGISNVNSASLTSQKVVTALSACLGTLTPAQREALLPGRAGSGHPVDLEPAAVVHGR